MASNPRQPRAEIAPMRHSDLDGVMEIERSAFPNPWSRQVFIEELDREWAHLEVVRERGPKGERVVAFCNYWLVRDEVHLLNIASSPAARRAGHAARLLAHIVVTARRLRCRFITLEVRRSNVGAMKLYRSFGFRSVGLRRAYYVEDGEDAVVMLLDL
jgi:[ribosomal protein S18]-alanine N-acetyltransferase